MVSADQNSAGNEERLSSADLLRGKKEAEKNYYSLFSSWCATLCDGMTLSLSSNGPEGVNPSAGNCRLCDYVINAMSSVCLFYTAKFFHLNSFASPLTQFWLKI